MKNLNAKKALPYALLLVVALVAPIFLHTSYWVGILIMVLYRVVGSVSLRTISLSGALTFAMVLSLRWAHTAAAFWHGVCPYLR